MIKGITWIAIKSFLKKAALWCKKYWQIFVGISIPLVLMIVFRKKPDFFKIIQRINDDHQREVDAIQESLDLEIKKRDEALSVYKDAIREIESKYQESARQLDEKKKKLIKKAIDENNDNPDEITKRISEITGIKIHVD